MSEDLFHKRYEGDPLSNLRESFSIPEGVVYLNGNSLGPLQNKVKQRLKEVIDLSVKRILEYDFSKRDTHYIHFLTGPGCLTGGFENWLDKMNLPKLNYGMCIPNSLKYFS